MSPTNIISTPAVNEYQSILDVFLLQGLINYQDYQKIKAKYATNAQIEAFLLSSKLLSVDSINRAYSIIYKMPFVDLKNLQIDHSVLSMVKPEFIKKYQASPFYFNNRVLSVAIAKPATLPQIIPDLERHFRGKARIVNLYITTPADLMEVVKQYSKHPEGLFLSKAKYPTVFLKNQNIAPSLVGLLPAEFIVKYHLVVFGQRDDRHYLIATDLIDNPETIKAIRGLEDQNNIFVEIFATSSEDIASIINQVTHSEKSAEVKKPEAPIAHGLNSSDGSFVSGIKDLFKTESRPEITVDSIQKDQPDRADKPTTDIEPKDDEAPDQEDKVSSGPITDLVDDQVENIGQLLDHDIKDKNELETIIKSAKVPKMVAAIISLALTMRASDVHFEPEEKLLRVRYRIDGILSDIVTISREIQPQVISRVKILSNMKLDESRVPQDGRFDVDFKHKQVDIRVSTLPTVRGEKVVMRLLDKSGGILSLEDLGMTGQAFKKTLEAIAKPYGIIISTGPTGSGKSTTLYAILNRISVPAVNIVTLEDPVEYEIPGINQCQIKPNIGFTFADGLRSILRQDPNVIMVGEVRDAETANMTTHAALTGHLVLTTLHTNDAAGALPRLTNMGVEPFLITSSINLIIGQRLVRRICPHCREEVKIPQNLEKIVRDELDSIPKSNKADQERIKSELKFYQGRGCKECNQGYRGRLGIFEVLSVSNKIEDMVIGRSGASDILKQAQEEGMITMRQDGILKSLEGLTTIDEVIRMTATF
jgi:type IV pilus assembly protein PilB